MFHVSHCIHHRLKKEKYDIFLKLSYICQYSFSADELLMEPCCALKYYPDIELCVNEMHGEEKSKEKQQRREKEENFGDSTIGKD
jgi:hypothetical protein